jgi:hypothetical protein
MVVLTGLGLFVLYLRTGRGRAAHDEHLAWRKQSRGHSRDQPGVAGLQT